jgi:EpsD family peptidyl-prolyl cis-trans isomerase
MPILGSEQMKAGIGFVCIVLISSMLGGCNWQFWKRAPVAPTGQVVATVGSHEITTRELQSELVGLTISPKMQKAAQQAALQVIIRRTILADAAANQGLDKDPDYVVRKDRADQLTLIQALEAKLARDVPEPTPDEASQYITDHPNLFGQRTVFTVDQIRFRRPNDPTFAAKLKPINTMDGIVGLLNANGIGFMRGTGTIDAIGQDPRVVDAIMKLPPQEVFVINSGNDFLVNQIHETKIVPFTGEPATRYALALIKRQRTQQAVSLAIKDLIQRGFKTVRFNQAFAPPPPVKAKATP